jgi:hypothetical protein
MGNVRGVNTHTASKSRLPSDCRFARSLSLALPRCTRASDTSPRVNSSRLSTVHSERIGRRGRALRARDLRFDANAAGQIFLLNKADGTLRVIER